MAIQFQTPHVPQELKGVVALLRAALEHCEAAERRAIKTIQRSQIKRVKAKITTAYNEAHVEEI